MDTTNLQIDQQRAQITIDIQQARLHVDMEPRRMVVHNEPPEMTIHREEGSIELDLKEFKSRLGLKMFDEMNRDAAAEGHAKALEAIRDTVNASAFIGDVSVSGQNKVGSSMKQDMLEVVEPSLDISSVPARIDMDGNPGTMEIEWSDSELSIEWEGGGMPQVYVDPPYSVDVYIKERPYVRISVTEGSYPGPSGRNFNTTV